MAELKIASFNGEWMTNLFVGTRAEFYQGPSLKGGLGAKPKDCQKVCGRIAGVIADLRAHIIGIEEGPPRKAQMELFVNDYLDGAYDVFSMEDGSQSIHVLVRKSLPLQVEQIAEDDEIYRHLEKKVSYYRWDEVAQESLEKFTRKPVVLRLLVGRKKYEIMVFHTKSKISSLKRREQYTRRDKPAIVDALRSRQKLSAEMAAVRRYLTHAIFSRRVDGCIVMGDLNDGPHRDVFEEKFLIHNIVDELRGGFDREKALMHHALPARFLDGPEAYTAEFGDPTQDGQEVRVLLDHILVSTGIYERAKALKLAKTRGKIEHGAFENHLDNQGKTRDDRPSDHRPISAVFEY